MHPLWSTGLAVVVVIVLGIIGLIPHLWMGFAILAIIGGYHITQKLDTEKTTLASKLLTFWIVGWILLPMLLTNLPATRQELTPRRESTDMTIAELLHPPAFVGKEALREWCNRVETASGMKISQGYINLRNNLPQNLTGFVPNGWDAQEDERLRQGIQELEKWRNTCKYDIFKGDPESFWNKIPWTKTAPLGALIGGGFLLAVILGKPGISRFTFALAVGIVIFGLVTARWLL